MLARSDFNSRPSARGDISGERSARTTAISIHAPPRGATPLDQLTLSFPFYFNSRPSARGDAVRPPEVYAPHHFNSRPSARGDGLNSPLLSTVSISIHAPPRGATHVADAILNGIDFNSRPSARGDPVTINFAKPRRHFNSRPSARGDEARPPDYVPQLISIHAPPRGATQKNLRKTLKRYYFNSRPSARGDNIGLRPAL